MNHISGLTNWWHQFGYGTTPQKNFPVRFISHYCEIFVASSKAGGCSVLHCMLFSFWSELSVFVSWENVLKELFCHHFRIISEPSGTLLESQCGPPITGVIQKRRIFPPASPILRWCLLLDKWFQFTEEKKGNSRTRFQKSFKTQWYYIIVIEI